MNKRTKAALRKIADHAEEFAMVLRFGDIKVNASYRMWQSIYYGECALCTVSRECMYCPLQSCSRFIPKGLKTNFENQEQLTKRKYRVRWFEQAAEDLRKMAEEGV